MTSRFGHKFTALLALAMALASPWCARAAAGAAQAAGVELTIAAPPTLRAGEVAAIEVRIRGAASGDLPLLLTTTVEGQAVDAVRGRMLRADASPSSSADELRFEVPLAARAGGNAVLKVELTAYQCAQGACQLLKIIRTRLLRVQLAAPAH